MSCHINTTDAKTLIAIDQHARSSVLYALNKQTGEVRKKRFTDCPSPENFTTWLDSWAQEPYYFAYESGPCGFYLARYLIKLGHMCDVIAVSSIPRSVKDKVTKDDFVDASCLLNAIKTNSSALSKVYIPSTEAEDARDLARQYQTISEDLRREKQRSNSFLLRHGDVYNEKTKTGRQKKLWGTDHKRWLEALKFKTPKEQEIFSTYYQKILNLEMELNDCKDTIKTFAQNSKFKTYIEALCAIKGVGLITAFTFCATVDDFDRFKSGKALASYLGLVPRRHNSGEKNSSGRITKCGDKTLRRCLIEAFGAVSRFSPYTTDAILQTLPSAVRAEIENANNRIIRRRNALKENGKNHNVIKVALAKEAACQMLFVAKAVDLSNS